MNQYFSLGSSHFHGGTLVFTVAQTMRDTYGLHGLKRPPQSYLAQFIINTDNSKLLEIHSARHTVGSTCW